MRSAIGCAALGLLLLVVAGTFDAEPLYVTGAALVLLGAGAGAWIALGAWGATVTRTIAARSVAEEEPLSVSRRGDARAACRCRPAGSTRRCCPSRSGSPPGAPARAYARR